MHCRILDKLGRQIAEAGNLQLVQGQGTLEETAGGAKIANSWNTIRRQQDIARLQIGMNHTLAVEIHDNLRQLFDKPKRR